jgi:molecular chaperone DnaK
MIKKAEQHASEDKTRKENIETKNRAEQSVYATKKSLSEHKDKLSTEQVTSVETAIKECEEALRSTDIEELKRKADALEQAAMKIGEAVYKNSGSSSSQTSSSSKEDDKTSDAEYESKETPKKK